MIEIFFLGIIDPRDKFGNCLFGVVQTAMGFDDHVNTPQQNKVKKQLVVLSKGKFNKSVATAVPTNTASPLTNINIADSHLAMSTRSKTANIRQSPSPSIPLRKAPTTKSTPVVRALSDMELIGTSSVASPSVAHANSPQVAHQQNQLMEPPQEQFLTKRLPTSDETKNIEAGKLIDKMAVDNIKKKSNSLSATQKRTTAGNVPGKKRKSGDDSNTAQNKLKNPKGRCSELIYDQRF
jgi:hypothetical protein